MGRYYNGDIEGKFWFGVQQSDDANHFGVEGNEPNYLEYEFEAEHLDDINKGINECIEKLGEFKDKLDCFFKENNGYMENELIDYLKVSEEKVKVLLENYARLDLGLKIKKCVEDNGSCSFTAEC